MAEQQPQSMIVRITSEHVKILYDKWSHMFEPNPCLELMQKLEERVNEFYMDLHKESEEQEQLIHNEIGNLEAEIADVTRLLHRNVDVGERPEEMPLVKWQQTLDKSIEDLREVLRERRAEICELLLQQEQLCEELGELPLPLLADPLPKPEEMSGFREHLERLQAERMRRMDELFQLRSQIKQDMKVLELVPQTAAEEHLLSQTNQCLTPNIFENLRFMKAELGSQVKELHERIDNMRLKINVLWERLQEKETDEFAMRRVREAKTYTQRTHDVLWEELRRCQELRRQNLKSFISQLRVEIRKWWDLTLKSEQERKRFSNYYNEWYNEDLLELHELELDDLKSFYNANKEIFELFGSRAEFWARMAALEAKANDPNRYNNRGGQLLKEERERKAISSKLPKIEQQIRELVDVYEKKNNSPFLVHGENILEHMASDWERLRQAKELQSCARKQAVTGPTSTLTINNGNGHGRMAPPLTPGPTAKRTPLALRNMSAMSSSTMSLRKTPSKCQLNTVTRSASSKTTGNLQKRKLGNVAKLDTPAAKRNLLKTLSSFNNKATKSPLKKKVLVLETTLRRSSGVKRRSVGHGLKKAHTKMAIPEIQVKPPSDDDDEYETDDNGEVVAGQEDVCNYNRFSPKVRSSELPQALILRHQASSSSNRHRQLPEPRRSRMWQPKGCN